MALDRAGTQETLLRACAIGDRAALERLYRMTAPQLFGLALRILRRRELAEEAVQDAFVAAWANAASFDPARGTAMAWLASIVRNSCIDQLRRSGRSQALDPTVMEAQADESPGPLEAALSSEAGRALRRCLQELEPGPRQSILLAYYEGLTLQEAAKRQGAPIGTVKSWVRRSLIRLKRCLDR